MARCTSLIHRFPLILPAAGVALGFFTKPFPTFASRVVVGGIYLDSDLIDADNSTEFRSYPDTGLYIHNGGTINNVEYGWLSLTDAQKQAMIAVWSPNGAQSLELGYEADATGWQNAYADNYVPDGAVGYEASANIPYTYSITEANGTTKSVASDTDAYPSLPASTDPNSPVPADWKTYVDGFRNLTTAENGQTVNIGINNIYPVYAPNSKSTDASGNSLDAWKQGDFATSSYFLDVRQMALYGGGISVDAPPQQFFNNIGAANGQALYQAVTEGEIAWANANHLQSIWIISPSTSKANYNAISQQLVQTLETNSTGSLADIPTEYCVENYGLGTDNDIVNYNPIGSEDSPNTELGVALWLAGYEQGRTGDLQLTPTLSSPGHLTILNQTASALAGKNTAVNLSAANLQPTTFTVTLQNTSTNSSNWYIPTLLAAQAGQVADWNVEVLLNGQNITSYLLAAAGFTFNATDIIANAGPVMEDDTSQVLSFIFTPLNADALTNPYTFDLTGLAHPDAADPFASIDFTTIVPEPSAALLAVGLIVFPLCRRGQTAFC